MVGFASQCILLHNIKIVTLLISDVILAVYQYHNYGLFYLVFFMFLVFLLFSCVSIVAKYVAVDCFPKAY